MESHKFNLVYSENSVQYYLMFLLVAAFLLSMSLVFWLLSSYGIEGETSAVVGSILSIVIVIAIAIPLARHTHVKCILTLTNTECIILLARPTTFFRFSELNIPLGSLKSYSSGYNEYSPYVTLTLENPKKTLVLTGNPNEQVVDFFQKLKEAISSLPTKAEGGKVDIPYTGFYQTTGAKIVGWLVVVCMAFIPFMAILMPKHKEFPLEMLLIYLIGLPWVYKVWIDKPKTN